MTCVGKNDLKGTNTEDNNEPRRMEGKQHEGTASYDHKTRQFQEEEAYPNHGLDGR